MQQKLGKGKQPFSQLKIGTKLILLLIFIAFISMGVVGALSYRIGRNIIDEQINQVLSIQTAQTLEAINKLVFERLNDMQLLISDSTLISTAVSLEEKTKVLKNKLISLGWYDQLHLTDPSSGTVVASTFGKAVGVNFSDEGWYQKVTQENFINVSNAISSPFSGKKVLMLTNTIQDEKSDILGILVAEFSMNVLSDLLKNLPEHLEVYVTTGSGEVLIYHGPEAAFNSSIDARGYYQYNTDYLQQEVQSKGYFSFDGNGWNLILQIPRKIAYEPIRNFTFTLLIVFAVIALLVIIAGHLASRAFVKPILALTEGVAKMQKGDLKQQVKVSSGDEVGYLTKGFNAMTRDLAEKTRTLLEEKGKYKSILESTNEAVVLFNPENEAVAWNEEFRKLFRKPLKLGQKAGSTLLSLFKKSHVATASEPAAEILQTLIAENNFKKKVALEITLMKPVYAILALYTKPVKGEDGRLVGRIWVFNNITQVIESERSRQEFIHVASHKLRTPITTVNWSSQMLLDGTLGALSPDQKAMLQQIELASNQLTSLCNILINVAEIQKDKIPLKKTEWDLKEGLMPVLAEVEKKADKMDNVNFKVLLPAMNIKIKADQAKIQQVLTALLDNAMRYRQEDRKNQVELRVVVDKKAKKATVSVSDQGMGIMQREQHKVFEKFFRGQGADLIYPDGTGLSLFLAKIILQSSGESIGFESTEGKGSRFWFTVGLA